MCVCVWEREEGEGGGARTREGINSQSDAPMVIVPGVLWWMGVGEGLWLSLHCARFSPVVSTATENTVVCL